ncbi:phage holin family protein [Actinomycetospora atypica]|uniref:Phage holin family protein n=1 Tax=Actinomycetospora atypica TaxID=1290095 RepID=A0ABV9YLY3_9PSEU
MSVAPDRTSAPTPPPDPGGARPAGSGSNAEPSIGQLLTQLSEQTSRLVRDELALAQVELKNTAKQAGIGAGLFGVAGILAVAGLGAGVATAIIALALLLPTWASALIVTALLLAAAGVAALLGRNKVQQVSPTPDRTVANVKLDVEEIQEARHHDDTRQA